MRFNPFNPILPAKPAFFVGRVKEREKFLKSLSQTINSSPMNLAIVGNRGVGKTSLLAKFEELAKKQGCLVVRLSNYEGLVKSVLDLAEYVTMNIKRELILSNPIENIKDKTKDFLSSFKFSIGYEEIKIGFEKKTVVSGLLRDKLKKIWEKVKDDYKAIVIMIDEAESIEEIEGTLMFLREVFSRLGEENCNYMLVLSGKLSFPEKMAEVFSPLNRFFPSVKLSGLSTSEIAEFLERKLSIIGVTTEKKVIDDLVEDSEGHPFILVSIAYILFENLGNKQVITPSFYQKNKVKLNAGLEDFFLSLYHPLTPKAKKVLLGLALNLKDKSFTFAEVLKITKKKSNLVSPYLNELVKKGSLNKLQRGEYEIFHRLYLPFLRSREGELNLLG